MSDCSLLFVEQMLRFPNIVSQQLIVLEKFTVGAAKFCDFLLVPFDFGMKGATLLLDGHELLEHSYGFILRYSAIHGHSGKNGIFLCNFEFKILYLLAHTFQLRQIRAADRLAIARGSGGPVNIGGNGFDLNRQISDNFGQT